MPIKISKELIFLAAIVVISVIIVKSVLLGQFETYSLLRQKLNDLESQREMPGLQTQFRILQSRLEQVRLLKQSAEQAKAASSEYRLPAMVQERIERNGARLLSWEVGGKDGTLRTIQIQGDARQLTQLLFELETDARMSLWESGLFWDGNSLTLRLVLSLL